MINIILLIPIMVMMINDNSKDMATYKKLCEEIKKDAVSDVNEYQYQNAMIKYRKCIEKRMFKND